MVFVDEGERGWRDTHVTTQPPAPVDQNVQVVAPVRIRPAPIQRPMRPVAPTPPLSLGCIGSFVRLLLFAAVVWYGGKWLLSIPEVRTLANAAMTGSFSDDQLNSAIHAVRAQILQLLGVSSSSR
jgi:hypothetical protein